MKQYIVDAFTDKPFSGNPAAVCVMDRWPSEEFMKNLAMENNLSETAFIVKEEHGYHLRWFTPASEVDLCGHATLASSYVIFNYFEKDKDVLEFDTRSGINWRSFRDAVRISLHPEKRQIAYRGVSFRSLMFRKILFAVRLTVR